MKTHLLRLSFALILAPLFLSSCLLPIVARTPHRVPFNEAEFAGYGGAGAGTVSGQLTVNIEGRACTGNGSTITLVPVTAYTQEMVDRELRHGELLSPADSRLKSYVRKVDTDSNGNFVFRQVPPGKYFVAGLAGYTELSNDNFVYQWGFARITVGKGQSVKLQLSDNPGAQNAPMTDKWTAQ